MDSNRGSNRIDKALPVRSMSFNARNLDDQRVGSAELPVCDPFRYERGYLLREDQDGDIPARGDRIECRGCLGPGFYRDAFHAYKTEAGNDLLATDHVKTHAVRRIGS
jgi:hypothetical protein